MVDTEATVLIVDDQPGIVDGHAARLSGSYTVRTAYDGEDALAQLDSAVDVVLLDRRMPGLSGDDVLTTIRERGLHCRVAMLTGVEPSFDIVDMGFDDYVRKPVLRERLLETVERLVRRSDYDVKLQRYFSLASKVAALETEHDRAQLSDHPKYVRLCEDLTNLRHDLDRKLEDLPPGDGYAVATGVGTLDNVAD
jgi:two-component system response regulator AdeR